ncbi:TlpA family protein disulfide reductase [Mucilaginibacter sp.]|uniref:TlpA family protein disulfide reductase n=1 Tax=Mucilaginibacter sp. TaxID=1882438 RepID=UPI003D116485
MSVAAQSLTVNLKAATDTSIIKIPSRPFLDTTFIAHIPKKNYLNWSLRRIAYYNLQATYENLPETPERKKLFKEFIKKYEFDTTYLTKQKISGNYIYLFTALDQYGNKHVIIDANNNHDFSDDHEYVLNDKSQTLPTLKANLMYYDGILIRNAWVPIQIDAFHTLFPDNYYHTELDKKLDVMINILLVNKTGTAIINNQSLKINILNYDELHPKSPFQINIQKLPFDKKNNNDYRYKQSDTLALEGNLYTIKDLFHNKLHINYIGKGTNKNAETGTLAPPISSVDIQTNIPFVLKPNSGKYTIIDFWGSWCLPCIKLIPEVKKLQVKHKQEIQFVSIAYDKLTDISKVQNLIKKNEMSWIQLLDDKNNKDGIIEQYKVNDFPTCLLIDPFGKVIFRGIGENGLKELMAYYKEITY